MKCPVDNSRCGMDGCKGGCMRKNWEPAVVSDPAVLIGPATPTTNSESECESEQARSSSEEATVTIDRLFIKRTPGPWELTRETEGYSGDTNWGLRTRNGLVMCNGGFSRTADHGYGRETEYIAYVRIPNPVDAEFIVYACNTVEAKDQRIALLLRLLRMREWSHEHDAAADYCMNCGNREHQGHKADCVLAAALADKEVDK